MQESEGRGVMKSNGTKYVKKPLTSSEREKYWEQFRHRDGYITHRNNKSRFGKQDILGCDIVSYDPYGVIFSQVSTVNHISHKRKQIMDAIKQPPETTAVIFEAVGIDGYKILGQFTITRIVQEIWIEDDYWEHNEIPVDITPPESISGDLRGMKANEGIINQKVGKTQKEVEIRNY